MQLGTTGDQDLEDPARLTLANEFRRIWHQEAMRERLVDAARTLHAHGPWGEGWKAIRSTVYFDYTENRQGEEIEPLPNTLAALQADLEPRDLIPTIMTYVLSKGTRPLRRKRRIPPRRHRTKPPEIGKALSCIAANAKSLIRKALAAHSRRYFLRSQHVVFHRIGSKPPLAALSTNVRTGRRHSSVCGQADDRKGHVAEKLSVKIVRIRIGQALPRSRKNRRALAAVLLL